MGYSFNFKFSEDDYDYRNKVIKEINYGDFYINEFFNASDAEKAIIYIAYRNRYGESAYNYFIKNYAYSWKYGDRKISDTQWSRIATLVRDNLFERSRYKLGRIEFFITIKKIVKSRLSNHTNSYKEDINDRFKRFNRYNRNDKVKTINNFNEFNKFLKEKFSIVKKEGDIWKNLQTTRILTEEEGREAIEIAELISNIKIQTYLDQIVRDLKTFSPVMSKNEINGLKSQYHISVYNVVIEIPNLNLNNLEIPKFNEVNFLYQTKYKDFIDKYLALELVDFNKEVNDKSINNVLNEAEIDQFFKNIESLKKDKNQYNIKQTFIGEGGKLDLEIIIRHNILIINEILKALAILLLLNFIVIGGFVLLINSKFAGWVILGIYLIFPYLSTNSEQIKVIINGIKDIKSNGK
jgi:hypothetical protein